MSTSAYMPLYIGDYLADAAHLTTEEHGAYLLLLMVYWQRGKPLPADPARLAMIARMSNERWTDVAATLQPFFDVVDGEWRHKRVEAELERYRSKVEKAKNAGISSANRRKATKPQPEVNGRSTDVDAKLELGANQSESESKEEEYISTSLPDAAREEGLDFDRRGRGSRGVSPRLKDLAEGLGLPVGDLIAKATAPTIAQPNAYFRSLAHSELRRLLPTYPDATLKAALTRDGDGARGAVFAGLMEAGHG